MTQIIKNYFNSNIAASATGTLINNDATVKAHVKTIHVCNPSTAANTFDIVLDGNVIYDDVAIAGKETVKFENENLTVAASTALTLVNNSLNYAIGKLITVAKDPLHTSILVTAEGRYFVAFNNTTDSSHAYYAVYDSTGTELKAPTVLYAAAATSSDIRVVETSTHVHVCHLENGSSYQHTTVIAKFDWTISTASSAIASEAYSWPAVARLKGANSDYVVLAYMGATQLKLDITNAGAKFTSPTVHVAAACTQIRATGLTDTNALIVYRDVSGAGQLAKYNTSIVQQGVTTQFTASVATIYGVVGLSNGDFAVYYRDAGNSNYPTLAIFNDDMTVAVAAATIRDADTMTISGSSNNYLFADSSDNIYVVFVDSADSNKWKVTSYTSAGTLITADVTLDELTTTTEDEASWDIDSSGNLIVSYEQTFFDVVPDGSLSIARLMKNKDLNVTLSGVEVTV